MEPPPPPAGEGPVQGGFCPVTPPLADVAVALFGACLVAAALLAWLFVLARAGKLVRVASDDCTWFGSRRTSSDANSPLDRSHAVPTVGGPDAAAGGTAPPASAGACELAFRELSFWVAALAPPTSRLSLVVRGGCRKPLERKQILCSLSGHFASRTLTAILGPSGCGKTSLLTLLAGRAKAGWFSGSRCLNGKRFDANPEAARAYQTCLAAQGFVPQTDYFFEELTVRETCFFAAMLRLPGHIDRRMARALDALHQVQLHHAVVQSQRVGGLSGGQRKRLSIAVELVRLPALMLALCCRF